jgi:hypothetical protein
MAYTLMYAPQPVPGATERSVRSSATFLRRIAEMVGPQHALPAARMIVAWANGFITMELAGAFRLGGDVEEAWHFGLNRILTAVRAPETPPPSTTRGRGNTVVQQEDAA